MIVQTNIKMVKESGINLIMLMAWGIILPFTLNLFNVKSMVTLGSPRNDNL